MSNQFQLTFKLKQHTPLIHFHDQPGATLRATEVKPKLDKYLVETLTPKNINYSKWLIGDTEINAFAYKMTITATNPENVKLAIDKKYNSTKDIDLYHTKPFPLLIANMGGKETQEELKNFVRHQIITVDFFSLHTDLLIKIREVFAKFLFNNNFGNRQSKGFGSFYLHRDDDNYIDPNKFLAEVDQKKIVYFELSSTDTNKDIFEKTDIVHRLLKSGYNFPDYSPIIENGRRTNRLDYNKGKGKWATYQKSFLISYFLKKYDTGSEKREIKEKLFFPNIKKDSALKPENKYVRAILGVAELFEYRGQDTNKVRRNGTVTVKGEGVDRFKSPITFKIIEDRVYILIQEDWKIIKDKKFIFSKGINTSIYAPDVDFELEAFLVDFVSHYNTIRKSELSRINSINGTPPNALGPYLNCLNHVELKIYNNA